MTSIEVPYSIAAALPTLSVMDITNEVARTVSRSGVRDGIAYIHTANGLTLVRVQERETGFFEDLEALLERVVPAASPSRERLVCLAPRPAHRAGAVRPAARSASASGSASSCSRSTASTGTTGRLLSWHESAPPPAAPRDPRTRVALAGRRARRAQPDAPARRRPPRRPRQLRAHRVLPVPACRGEDRRRADARAPHVALREGARRRTGGASRHRHAGAARRASRIELSPRLWLLSFVGTSSIYLVQADAESARRRTLDRFLAVAAQLRAAGVRGARRSRGGSLPRRRRVARRLRDPRRGGGRVRAPADVARRGSRPAHPSRRRCWHRARFSASRSSLGLLRSSRSRGLLPGRS